MRRHFLVPILSLLIACTAPAKPHVSLLNYSDFGPQVIASEVVGMEWWQWQPHGDPRPRPYPIKVAVFRDMSLDDVKKQFPVDEARELDYRYLQYETAMRYLDAKITEDVLPEVTAKLKATRARLTAELGDR
jgi:hypothetical protein